jgi:hypothetical protein
MPQPLSQVGTKPVTSLCDFLSHDRSTIRVHALLLFLAMALVCGYQPQIVSAAPPAAGSICPGCFKITASAGDGQSGGVSSILPRPLVITVTSVNPAGVPLANFLVNLTVVGGNGSGLLNGVGAQPGLQVSTGADGTASFRLMLGSSVGQYQVIADCFGCIDATFTETAVSGPAAPSYAIVVAPTNPTTLPSVIACSMNTDAGDLYNGITPHINFQAKFVNINATPIQDATGGTLTFSLSEVIGSGGHSHTGRQPYLGTPPPSGASPLLYQYTPPEASGTIHVIVNGVAPDGTTPAAAATDINIAADGSEGWVSLNGQGVDIEVDSHRLGVYGSDKMRQSVAFMSSEYSSMLAPLQLGPPDPLESQGASLPSGGLFDINHTWAPPHCAHRDGTTLDLSINNLDPDEQLVLRSAAEEAGFTISVEGGPATTPGSTGPHWHLHLNAPH